MDLFISIIIVTVLLIIGNFYVYYGYNKDKDEVAKKLSEYESILSNTAQGILVTGLTGDVLYMNEFTKQFLKTIDLPLNVGDPIEMLVNRLNQYSDIDDNLTVDRLEAGNKPESFIFKIQGLFSTYTYYDVTVSPFVVGEARMGQVLTVKNVTERVVSKMIDHTIIKTSLNAYSLKTIEDALKYFSSALEEIIDIDYVFASFIYNQTITYHINHREVGHANKIIKSYTLNPIASYVLDHHHSVIMTDEEMEAEGLGHALEHYDKKPKILIACPLNKESQYANGVVGLLFTEDLAYPELIDQSLNVIVKYISQVIDRISIEEKIHNLAYYDQLTELPNRNKFIMSLEQEMINTSLTSNQMLGVLFLDFSGLKRINDEYSHFVGDQLLKILAKALMENAEGMYIIGRLGGDEFGIYATASTRLEIEGIAKLILDIVDTPHMIEGHMVHVTGNIGISIYQEHGTHPEELIHKADEALFEAKNLGKSQYYMWE